MGPPAAEQGTVFSERLDLPPSPRAAARLPEDFGRRFLVFVDTEEEFDWSQPRRRDAVATTAIAALPATHRRLRSYGVNPAYMIDYPVADSPHSVELLGPLARAGECAIGAQLHPWVNPPQIEEMTAANSFVGNCPEPVEQAKLAMLTERIERAFGQRPIIYRAGRYGVGANSAAVAERLGYRLDVSVRALFDYSGEGGPDFSRHPIWPWWTGPQGRLLELPLTSAFVGPLRRSGHGVYRLAGNLPHVRGFLARTRLLSRVALTPEGIPLNDALAAVRTLLDIGVSLFSLSFHSPSVVPGHTPYVRDAADLYQFHSWWETVLDLFAREGVRPASAAELIDAAWAEREGRERRTHVDALASRAPPPLSPPGDG